MGASEIRISSLVTPDEFRELARPDDRIAYGHLGLRIGIHAVLLWAMAQTWFAGQHVLAILIAYVNAVLWQFIGYAGIGHELFHRKVFSNKAVNTVFYKLASYLTWANPAYFDISHNFHHRSTFDDKDSEIYREFPVTAGALARLVLLDYQTLYRRVLYALVNAFGYEIYFGTPTQVRPMPVERRGAQRDAVAMLAVNGVWLALFFLATRSPVLTLIVFLTPFIGALPNRVLALAQHVGLDDHKDDGALLFSRTMRLPAPIAFFYANMNYHAEHHLLPSVPYYKLPRLYALLEARLELPREEREIGYLFSSDFWNTAGKLAKA